MRRGFTVILIFFLVLPFLYLATSVVIWYPVFRSFESLRDHAVATRAVVSNLRTASVLGSPRYYVYYCYRTHAQGRTRQGWDLTTARPFGQLRAGATVPIIYDAADPATSALNIDNAALARGPFAATLAISGFPRLAAIYPAINIFWVSIVLFSIYWGEYRRQARLLRWGKLARASVVSRGRVVGLRWSLIYKFSDERGSVAFGRARSPVAVDTVTALYDPNDSSKNILYPSMFVECVGK